MHHGLLLPYDDHFPKIAADACIAPSAVLIGNVSVGAGSCVLFNCTLRGDVNFIKIGEQSNIQDGTVIHVASTGSGTTIGNRVSIAHSVLLHACTLEDEAFVGMGATVMDDSIVEGGGMVAAGALVTPRQHIKRGELWAGRPAKLWREMDDAQIERNMRTWSNYFQISRKYLAQGIGAVPG
jgi:carbonic anhydrase/acetyltransferase-like protein (isoleucine patch superfamily)